ncbi:MAG: cellulase family glycosylhydrolase [Caldilineaceae bacterium]
MIILVAIGALAGLGTLITRTQSGADPATALNLIPVAPPDLEERLVWLPDRPLSDQQRELEPNTRELITGSYLRAWAQWGISLEIGQPYGLQSYFSGPALAGVTKNITETVASGWTIRQSNLHHELELHYYADDGSIVSFTDTNLHLVQQFQRADGQASVASDNYLIESSHRYDVVMLLEDGNWRIFQWLRTGDAKPQVAGPWNENADVGNVPPTPNGIVQLQGDQLLLNHEPYTVAGINYYPQASPWTKFWPEYDPAQTALDLAQIRGLGLNTVRIFLSYADFGGAEVLPERRAQLGDFLAQAEQTQLQVIITLFDHHTDHHPATWAADARHLATLIPEFANHTAILAWDIKNEPDRDYGYNSQALVDGWLRFVARHVRYHDPNHLITIGWSTPEAATALTDIVDFVAFHYFDQPTDYPQRGLLCKHKLRGNRCCWKNLPFRPGIRRSSLGIPKQSRLTTTLPCSTHIKPSIALAIWSGHSMTLT